MSAWPIKSLDDIFEIARGGSPRPIDKFVTEESDGINWITISDASASSKFIRQTKRKIRPSGVTSSRLVKPGDFLLTNSMSFGRPYILDMHGCIHDGWLVLSPKTNNVDQDYFYHLLGSPIIFQEFSRLAAGATVKNLNIDLVKSVKVTLPPRDEQKRIAAILDQTDELRRKRQCAIDRLNQLGQAIFYKMFGDVRTPSQRFSERSFAEIADVKLGKMLDRGKSRGGTMKPYLRNANVRWFEFDLSDISEMEFTDDELPRFSLEYGDLLICEGGEPGRCAVWKSKTSSVLYQKALHRARIDCSQAEPDFLAHWFYNAAKAGLLADSVTSATIAHLTGEKIKALRIGLPPIEEQQRFQRRLESLQKVLSKYSLSKARSDDLFSSVQARAFRGEL